MRIRAQLQTSLIGRSIIHFPKVGSTNDVGAVMAGRGAPDGTVLIADFQSGGHGRRGRSWLSDPGESLLLSVILRPRISPADAFHLTIVPALAVLEAIERLGVARATLKWPNDVLAGGRKIAGILTELSLRGDQIDYAVVGIGLNVNLDPSRHTEIEKQTTSLMSELGRRLEREDVAAILLPSLDNRYLMLSTGQSSRVFQDWHDRLATLGHQVEVSEGGHTYSAFARDVSTDGGLILERNGSVHVVFAGDVSVSE